MKTAAVVVIAVLASMALVGCTLKMGNTSVGLFEGWNQPTSTVQRTETVTPPPQQATPPNITVVR